MHGSYKTEAVVLRSMRLGEADRILHLYTPARGRVGAVAKGVRRTRSRVGGRLEPFSHVALVLHEGRGELHTISGVDTVATHHEVREQPERARIAGACGEALLKLFAEGDPSPRVFAALCRLLEVLDGYAPRPATSPSTRCSCPSSSSSTGSRDSRRGSPHALRALPRECRSCASRRPREAPCAPTARAPSRCRRACSRRSRRSCARRSPSCPHCPARRRDRLPLRLRSERRARRLPPALAGADGRRVSRLGSFVLVAAAATSQRCSSARSRARRSAATPTRISSGPATLCGTASTGHAAFDYTVPKPFEQGVAALGTELGAATFVFEWTSLAGVFACAVAAAALARRLGPYPAAPLAALFALCLPVLWRGGRSGTRTCPTRRSSSAPRPPGWGRRPARRCSASPARYAPRRGGWQ